MNLFHEKYIKIILVFILIGFLTLISCKEEKSVEPESEITGSLPQIIEPKLNSIFNDPEAIKISWNATSLFNKYELYFSKYNETEFIPGNKIEYSSDWILLNDNIDGSSREYIWEYPYLYSDMARIKLIGILDNEQYEILSDVFTVYLKEILSEEIHYQEKLAENNKWVYKITTDYFGSDSAKYYIVKNVVSSTVEDGKKYYEIKEDIIKDTISSTVLKVIDREHYSPSHILQDSDLFVTENFGDRNGNWLLYLSSSYSCRIYNEMVFTENLLIKQYHKSESGSGTSSETTKRAKDIGIYYKRYNAEGFHRTTNLLGALIDGVVYGDTALAGR